MGLVENLKDLADLAKKAGDIELYRKIAAAEEEVRDLTRDKRRLEDRVEELESALRFKEETEFRAPFYYLIEGDQTPYCPSCWEKDKHAVHVVFKFDDERQTGWVCPACKHGYHVRKDGGGQRSQSGSHTPGVWS